MHIEKLSLFGFKNYEEVALTFSNEVNCLVGENGSGKTNLLDAIHYLSMTRSAFNTIDSQNVKFGEEFFSIRGDFRLSEKALPVLCSYQEGKGKTFKVNKKEYARLSEHVGKLPVVLIAPNDTDIIRDGSEARRKFFDAIISQIDAEYLDNLISYSKYLKQRNSALKRFANVGRTDYELLKIYDEHIIGLSLYINQRRSDFIIDFEKLFQNHYDKLSEGNEKVSIHYRSEASDSDFKELYNNALRKDLALERTTMGVHKDDFRFTIEGKPLKKFGSQGQQKTFLVSLKMGHFDIIRELKGFKPILLLDDIFDKLDSRRIQHLMERVVNHDFGQIFITDAREERTRTILNELKISANFYRVNRGTVIQ
ncbi:DNA replication/repair protein RecF [Fulvivirga sediminis]|uniref:DNA replication and repair protein RecF n=1 Tax=Fulvivirga sediminis TaxID=2803949 RepID=A0A937JZ76_9BACT|nr:DNA replication/repair protein RecF [Fulvivirga sediminis]MBL3655000.1 DNA replication/repair protein RecF [Fulvivirga sediminis]